MEEETKEAVESVQTEMGDISEQIEKGVDAKDREDARTLTIQIENLYFSKDNSGIILGDQANLENIAFGGKIEEAVPEKEEPGRECVVMSKEELNGWIAQHYNDFEMAFLLALAVFEKSPCTWVYESAEDLFRMMDGDKEEAQRERLRIPHQKRIEIIGGKEYRGYIYNHTGRVEEDFIRFQSSEYALRVLECVWNEFRYFREWLFTWLGKYISRMNYSKSVKAINALAILLENDFSFFENKAIKPLLAREDLVTDFAVAQIMVQAHDNARYSNNIENLFLYWTKQRKVHCSFITLMMCVTKDWPRQKIKEAIQSYINEVLREIEEKRDDGYERYLSVFYAIGNRKAAYFKMIVEVLYEKLSQYDSRKDRNRKQIIGYIFWLMLLIDDKKSNIDVNRPKKHKDMIFVKMCLIKNDTAVQLQELWKYLWKSRELHKMTKVFLEKYLFQYGGCGDEHITYLRQFLYSFQDTQADRDDMEFFLKKIAMKSNRAVRAAEKISQRRM